jgi:tetratricopeptide (TPR) repeat protein/predicted Ser/Thr protein kinase
MIGQMFHHYRIVSELGRGGMGVVYAAEDTKLQRKVALKILHASQNAAEGQGEGQRRLMREARAAAQLQHPHICPVFGFEESEGRAYLVLAYIEGKPLSKLIAGHELSLEQILKVTEQVAGALDAAHAVGIVHRDIKPGNILVTSDLHAYILDFGLARQESQSTSSLDGNFAGTPAYVAPEQAQGKPVTAASDQYSLAVAVYEMLTGRLPFAGGRPAEMLYRVVYEAPAALTPSRFSLSESIEGALLRALSKDPADRFPTVSGFAAALQGEQAGVLSTKPMGLKSLLPAADNTRPKRRQWILALAATLLGAAALGGVALWQWPLPAEELKKVAVLPLNVVGGDMQLATLAQGFAETLTTQLSEIEELPVKLSVVPASEVRARRVVSAEEARRYYNVNFAITGNAQRQGEMVIFTLSLVDAEKLTQAATRTLRFEAAKAVAVQDAAIPAALQMLKINLPAGQSESLQLGGTRNSEAYAKYLEGRGLLARHDQKGNLAQARTALENSVALDGNYALAYTALGEAYWRLAKQGLDAGLKEQAISASKRAVELAEKSAAAHAHFAECLEQFDRTPEAIEQLKIALQIAPSHGQASRAIARLYGKLGRDAEAEGAFEEAQRRRPTDWMVRTDYGAFLLARNRYVDAERAFQAARELTPDNTVVLRLLGNTYMANARFQEAAATLRAALRFQENPAGLNALGVALYYRHGFEEAETALQRAIALDNKRYRSFGNLGTVQRQIRGKEETAKQNLGRAVQLVQQSLELNPNQHNDLANLAEYYAKLGDAKGAEAAIARIPEDLRRLYADRIGLAWELLGKRAEAIAMLRQANTNRALLEADPDLAALSRDAAWKRAWKN